ncbi:hypothetical protein Pelo_16673 [Pelomyxa schiedti]|nr:hypothetical protein Pelo_16673 [Pelomyxa schiedti]
MEPRDKLAHQLATDEDTTLPLVICNHRPAPPGHTKTQLARPRHLCPPHLDHPESRRYTDIPAPPPPPPPPALPALAPLHTRYRRHVAFHAHRTRRLPISRRIRNAPRSLAPLRAPHLGSSIHAPRATRVGPAPKQRYSVSAAMVAVTGRECRFFFSLVFESQRTNATNMKGRVTHLAWRDVHKALVDLEQAAAVSNTQRATHDRLALNTQQQQNNQNQLGAPPDADNGGGVVTLLTRGYGVSGGVLLVACRAAALREPIPPPAATPPPTAGGEGVATDPGKGPAEAEPAAAPAEGVITSSHGGGSGEEPKPTEGSVEDFVTGRVSVCDVVMPSMHSQLLKKPRILHRMVNLLALMCAEEASISVSREGVTTIASALLALYEGYQNGPANSMFSFYISSVLPQITLILKLHDFAAMGVTDDHPLLLLSIKLETQLSELSVVLAQFSSSPPFPRALSAATSHEERALVFSHIQKLIGCAPPIECAVNQTLEHMWTLSVPSHTAVCKVLYAFGVAIDCSSANCCIGLAEELCKFMSRLAQISSSRLFFETGFEFVSVVMSAFAQESAWHQLFGLLTSNANSLFCPLIKDLQEQVQSFLQVLCSCIEAESSWDWVFTCVFPQITGVMKHSRPESEANLFESIIAYTCSAVQSMQSEQFMTSTLDTLCEAAESFDPLSSTILILFLRLGVHITLHKLDASAFSFFLRQEFASVVAPIYRWCAGNKEVCAPAIRAMVEFGIRDVETGSNYLKALSFNFARLLRDLDQTSFVDPLERLHILQAILGAGSSNDDKLGAEKFLVFAVPLAMQIASPCTSEQLNAVLVLLTKNMESPGYPGLMQLHSSFTLFSQYFPDYVPYIKVLFMKTVKRARKNELKAITDLSMVPIVLKRDTIRPLILCLFGVQWPLTHSKLEVFLPLLVQIVQAQKTVLGNPVVIDQLNPTTPTPQEIEAAAQQKKIDSVTQVLIDIVIAKLTATLQESHFNESVALELQNELSLDLLYRSLFSSELASLHDQQTQQIVAAISNKLPVEILSDPESMDLLSLLGRRIFHVKRHRYNYRHVADIAIAFITQFVTFTLPPELCNVAPEEKLLWRRRFVDEEIYQMPENRELRDHLIQCGYKELLWQRYTDSKVGGLQFEVTLTQTRNVQRSLMNSLRSLFEEYVDLLKGLGVTSVNVPDNLSGEAMPTPIEKLFAGDNLTHDDLVLRRRIAVQTIESAVRSSPRSAEHALNRKQALQVREVSLEADAALLNSKHQSSTPNNQATYRVRLLTTFLQTAACCNSNIVGCYAPDGDHAEKPLENSIKANVAFASLEEKKGDIWQPEMENLEIVFTDQGLYIYKLYTNGHPYDTSLAWVSFFRELMAASLVPGVIIPKMYPDPKTYALIAEKIPPQTSNSIITMRDSVFEKHGVESWYDGPGYVKPTKITIGDIYVTSKNFAKLPTKKSAGRGSLTRSSGSIHFSPSFRPPAPETPELQQPPCPNPSVSPTIPPPSALTAMPPALSSQPQVIPVYIAPILPHSTEVSHPTSTPDTKVVPAISTQSTPAKKDTYAAAVRQKQSVLYDLSGTLKDMAIKSLKNDPDFVKHKDTLKAFGKYLTTFVSTFLHKGSLNLSILSNGFNLDLWNKKQTTKPQKRNTSASVPGASCGTLSQSDKTAVVERIGLTVENILKENLYSPTNVCIFLKEKPHLLGELIAHLSLPEISIISQHDRILQLRHVKTFTRASIQLVPINSLTVEQREQVMVWIFRKEDHVWRNRGGRPETENIFMYKSLATHTAVDNNTGITYQPFPGLVAVSSLLQNPDIDVNSFSSFCDSIVGYSVGEFLDTGCYEVITAWVADHWRSLGIASSLYNAMLPHIAASGCYKLLFEVLDGSFETWALAALSPSNVEPGTHQPGTSRTMTSELALMAARFAMCGQKQHGYLSSYTVGLTQKEEHFVKYILSVRRMMVLVILYKLLHRWGGPQKLWIPLGVGLGAAVLLLSLLLYIFI